jgi:hypothetical protein
MNEKLMKYNLLFRLCLFRICLVSDLLFLFMWLDISVKLSSVFFLFDLFIIIKACLFFSYPMNSCCKQILVTFSFCVRACVCVLFSLSNIDEQRHNANITNLFQFWKKNICTKYFLVVEKLSWKLIQYESIMTRKSIV